MTLPISICPRESGKLPGGSNYELRGLSRAEAIQARLLMPDAAAVEKLSLSFAFDTPLEAVEEWYKTANSEDVAFLVNRIARLSGLWEEGGKDDAEDLPSAK